MHTAADQKSKMHQVKKNFEYYTLANIIDYIQLSYN